MATLNFTFKAAQQFNKKGALLVECGVAAGAQIIAMLYGAPNAHVLACDSFDGIPLPSNRDDQMPGIKMLTEWERKCLPDPGKQALLSSGATIVPIESFYEHIKNSGVNSDNLVVLPGWFEETVEEINGDISLLRLDGDLFNSTWVCLQHLFPKVIQGGCVIIDDWTLPGCQAACKEYFELIGYEPDYKYLDGTSYFFK